MLDLTVDPTCPLCSGTTQIAANSVIAPFLSTVFHLPVGLPSTYRRCGRCDFRFFDARYGERELSLLYGQYRGEQYQRDRRHWEPWYSSHINDAYSGGGATVADRRDFMMQVLRSADMASELDCAVDYGGDEGQFFPDIPTARKLICDVSQGSLAPGVERIDSLADLGDTKADLVIAAHVLEHLPNPRSPLTEIREIIADDGILYVEVPLDGFRVRRSHASERYRTHLRRISSHRWLFILMDLWTGVWRQFRSSIPPLGIVKQSEHINYFSDRSIHDLLASTGFRVVAQRSDPRAKVGGLRIGRYAVAARPVTP